MVILSLALLAMNSIYIGLQECIPVGCVLTVAVAIEYGGESAFSSASDQKTPSLWPDIHPLTILLPSNKISTP